MVSNASQPLGAELRGEGFGLMKVMPSGSTSIVGMLPDGTKFTAASSLTAAQQTTVYSALYLGRGSLAATLTIGDMADVDLAGSGMPTWWFRPASNTQWYPDGWPQGLNVAFNGTKYHGPTDMAAAIRDSQSSPANCFLEVNHGGLGPVDTVQGLLSISYDLRSVVSLDQPDTAFTVKLSPETGTFSGTFTHVNELTLTKKHPFQGVVLFKQGGQFNRGYGFFLSPKPAVLDFTGTSGQVILGPSGG